MGAAAAAKQRSSRRKRDHSQVLSDSFLSASRKLR